MNYEAIADVYGDLTGFEASSNKIHIEDYVDNQHRIRISSISSKLMELAKG